MPHVLIVDDEPGIASALELLLKRTGYKTTIATDGPMALEKIRRAYFDLALIDVELGDPLFTGIDLCRTIQSQPENMPIIMLSAVYTEDLHKVLGLEAGAINYLTKPYNDHVLLASVKAVLRSTPAAKRNILDIDGKLKIDPQGRQVWKHGSKLEITPKEFDLLVYLATNAGYPFTRTKLIDNVWEAGVEVYDRVIDKHISTLRKKIEDDPSDPQYILSVQSIGYKFREW